MKKIFISITICLMLTFLVGISYARVIHIPGDFETIQEGINAALDYHITDYSLGESR